MRDRDDLPPFAWLRAFEAAGRTGSFKDAARDLHVSPSSISHQIRDLERFLGASLFVRRTRAVDLTPVGKRYLEHVRTAFDALAGATEQVRGRRSDQPLRIGMLPFTASEVFVPALRRLSEVLAGVEFEIESRIHLADLRTDAAGERLDAVIRYGEGRFEGLTGVELTRVRLDVICSPGRARAHPLREPGDVPGQPLVVLRDDFQGWRLWGRAHGLDLPGGAETLGFDNYPSVLRAVEQGLGLGLGLLPLVQPWIDAGRVVRPLDAAVEVRESMYLVFAPGGERSAQLETVAHQLRAVLSDSSRGER